MFDLTDSMTQ